MEPYGIPKQDLEKFMALPERCRREVQRWVIWMMMLDDNTMRIQTVNEFCAKRKLKPGTVNSKLGIYRRCGWQGLINRAKFPSKPAAASDERFLRFLHGLWIANDKNYRNTHRQLVAIWKQKAPIPGYKVNPISSSWNDCPEGWTYANMIYHIKTHIKNNPELKAKPITL